MKKQSLNVFMVALSTIIFMSSCGTDNRVEQVKNQRLTIGNTKLDIDMDFTVLSESQFTVRDSIQSVLDNFKYRDELSFATVDGMMSVTQEQLDSSILERDEFLSSTDMWNFDGGLSRWAFVKDSLRHIVIGNELGISLQEKYSVSDLSSPLYDVVTYKIEFFNPVVNSDVVTESTYLFDITNDNLVGSLDDGLKFY